MTVDPAAWRLASAHGRVVAVPVGEPDDADALAALHPDERAALAAVGRGRRAEWIAGRRALRAALAEVGTPAAAGAGALVIDERGAPVVPHGLVGSISHKRALAVALAAADDGWRVGVDLEQRGVRSFDIARRVLTPPELAAIASLAGVARDHAVIRAFALKEAVYKAIDPFLRRYVGFLEVAVWPADSGGARVEGAPLADLDVEASWRLVGDELVLCTARARKRR